MGSSIFPVCRMMVARQPPVFRKKEIISLSTDKFDHALSFVFPSEFLWWDRAAEQQGFMCD